jgi:hypothetical protein
MSHSIERNNRQMRIAMCLSAEILKNYHFLLFSYDLSSSNLFFVNCWCGGLSVNRVNQVPGSWPGLTSWLSCASLALPLRRPSLLWLFRFRPLS